MFSLGTRGRRHGKDVRSNMVEEERREEGMMFSEIRAADSGSSMKRGRKLHFAFRIRPPSLPHSHSLSLSPPRD